MRGAPAGLVRSALFAAVLAGLPHTARPDPLEAIHDWPPAEIVVIGEVHDNPEHHLNQARALQSLAPAAVLFEMLSPAQADVVNSTAERGAALGDAIGWSESGWPPWTLYAPVFAALGDARVYGMALPREVVRAAATDGAAAAFDGDPAPFGLDQGLPEAEQRQREALQLAAHCDALPDEMLPGMVEAQRLRDAHFASIALRALEEVGAPVVVIAGSGHARSDWGIPAMIASAAPGRSVLSIGQLEHGAAAEPETLPPFDRLILSAPAERPDPCAAFRDRPGDGNTLGGG